jgi:hypothetical protein
MSIAYKRKSSLDKLNFIETEKRGKWRRWLAKVYLKDSIKTLNEELVEKVWLRVWGERKAKKEAEKQAKDVYANWLLDTCARIEIVKNGH